MSFEIIENSSNANGGIGRLEGYDLYNLFGIGVAYGFFKEEDAREILEKYDGYVYRILSYGSVVQWRPKTVEAICIYSPTVGGGHCGGIRHTDEEDIGEPWGLWFTTADYQMLQEGRDGQLAGYDVSS